MPLGDEQGKKGHAEPGSPGRETLCADIIRYGHRVISTFKDMVSS